MKVVKPVVSVRTFLKGLLHLNITAERKMIPSVDISKECKIKLLKFLLTEF